MKKVRLLREIVISPIGNCLSEIVYPVGTILWDYPEDGFVNLEISDSTWLDLKPEDYEEIKGLLGGRRSTGQYSDEWARGCLDVTRLLEEHPEGWDGPCECQLCLSYGDE
ncbi:hypothetical protein [Candidatus Manganitrophus noduliformans]|uniref:Uncharacterized protein n=1 Tax=Candidatus Manganitrophus noduliformans TaxID=2606439 RepID=A0A7X6DML3_9BACT|nr:hypothetical protein [Candidatus Manganitrophus noduliformans]NKE69859.1 hypothetical protein [Candidatus Manganitrophus noduliformans]